MKILAWLLALAVLVYVAICIAAYSYQRSLIYFPQPRAVTAEASTLRLQVPGADLIVTVRPAKGPRALVYFGGNGEDVSYNLSVAHLLIATHA